MAMASMTGFARVDGGDGPVSWTWEARSVNGRSLDVRVRLAQALAATPDAWDALARDAMKARLSRGSVQVSVHVRRAAEETGLRLNRARLRAFAAEAARLTRLGLAAPARADGLLALRGVLEAAGDPDAGGLTETARAALRADLATLAERLAAACVAEGAALTGALERVLAQIEALHGEATAAAADVPAALRARLHARLQALVQDAVSPERLAQEAAVLAVKADVREELDRLAAHIQAARGHLAAGGAVGRKLDFLAQEFMRETNTLCAKSADMEITRVGLALKAAVEQFREQVQNVA